MSGEIIAILSVGIGLGLLSTGLFAWLRTDLVKVEERLRADLVTVEERLRADLVTVEERLRTDLVTVEERLRPTSSSWPTGSGGSNTVRPSWRDCWKACGKLSPVGPPANKSILSDSENRCRQRREMRTSASSGTLPPRGLRLGA